MCLLRVGAVLLAHATLGVTLSLCSGERVLEAVTVHGDVVEYSSETSGLTDDPYTIGLVVCNGFSTELMREVRTLHPPPHTTRPLTGGMLGHRYTVCGTRRAATDRGLCPRLGALG